MEALIIQDWHWLILGLLLLGAEALGAGGVLVGAAIAALLMAVIRYLVDFSWEWQIMLYASLSVVFTLVVWKHLKKRKHTEAAAPINDRAAQMIGRIVTIDETLLASQGKVQIGDTFWKVRCEEDIVLGAKARVIGSEGMVLVIEAIEPAD